MLELKSNQQKVSAFSPATCSNLAVGFDILGCALTGVGDTVTLERREDDQLVITDIVGQDSCIALPREVEHNTASAVIAKVMTDHECRFGFSVHIDKGIPLGSGLGGSAASAVAALVAFNAFLEQPMTLRQLQQYALWGEALATGQPHGDNVFPALEGGLVLIQSIDPVKTLQLPRPSFYLVLVCPNITIKTRDARALLQEPWPLGDVVRQSADLASVIAGLYSNDDALLRDHLIDSLIGPRRSSLIPGFESVCHAAREEGAMACSLSGSGPTMFAVVSSVDQSEVVRLAMIEAFAKQSLDCQSWVSPVSSQGASVIKEE